MSKGTGAACITARDTDNIDNVQQRDAEAITARDTDNVDNVQQREVEAIIARLGMRPHVEGGYYAMADNDTASNGADAARAPYSVIYFLLTRQQKSHWHKLDAAEVWFWHSGSPLEMCISQTGERVDSVRVLGTDLGADQRPQVTVPKDAWQTARPLGGWALVSCMMAPQFAWSGFTLAPPDWAPGAAT
ncbi:Cupin [Pandoravirus macleodensis]|uniref:Cupin n=1 Tax=Pandoravirus macleodensis TaxID=2107707 RepID=A0A2U7UFY0_9VIRU|nr:Cupin [Pandoravirus macleodensis]AVK77387.1 Cupin [Pandoravirus macleodensis]